MPNEIILRVYQPSDLDALRRITIICFDGVSIDRNIESRFGVIGGKSWEWRKARHIDADVTAQPDGVFVAADGDEPVGYITSRVDHDSKIGWIPNLGVLPEYRGQGLGKRLMERCFEYQREQGMEYLKIETLAQNDIGSNFYPAAGFIEVARQIHYLKPLRDSG
ncbi:MAG: GNAT family N-acetyltransferase [Candidatus Poribacteria bacterium]|nr:GNAT family N-acetyltransferase [Candidatus Poribacteria bacterium]